MSQKATQQITPKRTLEQHRAFASPDRPVAFQPRSSSVFTLQQHVGNEAMSQLLKSGTIRAKLRVSQPGDPDEIEAESIAQRIASSPTLPSATLHRKCSCSTGRATCAECEEEQVEQAKGIHRKSSRPWNLQNLYGNQAVLRKLSRSTPTIQTKLTVNKPGDRLEQEADRVADQVMHMTELSVQRSCASCTASGVPYPNCEGKKEKEIMRKDAGVELPTAPPVVHKDTGPSAWPARKKSKEDCAKFPGGSTDCEFDQTTGLPTGKVTQEIEETNPCTRPCVQEHEAVHVKQMKTFCPQLRDCYIAADKGKRPASDCVKMAMFTDEKECAAYKVSVPCLEKRLKTAKECQSKENKEYGTRKLETSEKCFLAIDCAPPAKSEERQEKQKEKPPTIHRRAQDSGDHADSWVPDAFQSNLGAGRPLDAATRAFMEPRFGYDFSAVRMHTDAKAAESAKTVNALAFTLGHHVVFGAGQYSPETEGGRRLLAHELVHVVQQASVKATPHTLSLDPADTALERKAHDPTESEVRYLQREPQPAAKETDTFPELEEILPQKVGPLIHMFREVELYEIFGEELLREHVHLIHESVAARKFVLDHGVPGIVALYDARRGKGLDVAAAERALAKFPKRYSHEGLEGLRLRTRREVPPSFWFEDPASQHPEDRGEGKLPPTSSEERKKVFVEPIVSQAKAGKHSVAVRFAYPEPDAGTPRVKNAKEAILNAIANVMKDLTGLPPAALPKATSVEELREQEGLVARLSEAWRALTPKSPLKVYIATDPREEFETAQVAAVTEKVFIREGDVGKPEKLQAAIRVPLIMLQGGMLPTTEGIQNVPKATSAQLQRTLSHEALHVLLIGRSSDASTLWEANRTGLKVDGNPVVTFRFVELVRKYLIAQEEVFAYVNEATLYPPVSETKSLYEVFIKGVERFLEKRRLKMITVTRSIPVSERVAGKAVTWTITYKVPAGAVELSVGDMKLLDLLLESYVLK